MAARRRAILLPTRASAAILRETIEAAALARGRSSILLPDLLTREDWLACLLQAVPQAPPRLTRLERELLLARAARAAAARSRMPGEPFEIRPGLVAEMLDLYDDLQRRQRSVRRFARTLFDQLRVERGTDRGSEGLLHQTCFLSFAFLGYERAAEASGAWDEHMLRQRLLRRSDDLEWPFEHIVVAVGDHPSDPRGLWPADFDLLGRLRGFRALDVVVTDETHDAGFRERIERELPGIEETRLDAGGAAPIVIRPPGSDPEALCFVHRDREDELRGIARDIRRRAADAGHELRARTGVVFQRPLPYLYLAQQVFADAGVPFAAFDALPLAAEPYAALLDRVVAAARTGGTREAMSGVLRSPWLRFEVDGVRVDDRDIAALDRVLDETRTTGEADVYEDAVARHFGGRSTDRGRAGPPRRRGGGGHPRRARAVSARDVGRAAGGGGRDVSPRLPRPARPSGQRRARGAALRAQPRGRHRAARRVDVRVSALRRRATAGGGTHGHHPSRARGAHVRAGASSIGGEPR